MKIVNGIVRVEFEIGDIFFLTKIGRIGIVENIEDDAYFIRCVTDKDKSYYLLKGREKSIIEGKVSNIKYLGNGYEEEEER